MSADGFITVRWLDEGEVVSEKTAPYELADLGGAISSVAEAVKLTGVAAGREVRFEVEFDPPVRPA